MLLCVFEDETVSHLRPLSLTRAAFMLRAGSRTLLEVARDNYSATGTVLHCRPSLAGVVREKTGLPVNRLPDDVDTLFVNGRLIDPAGSVAAQIVAQATGDKVIAFLSGDRLAAAWIPAGHGAATIVSQETIEVESVPDGARTVEVDCVFVDRLWHLLEHIEDSVAADFRLLSKGYNILERPGAKVSDHATMVNGNDIYVAPGASIRAGAVLDASSGPVVIGKDATVYENAVVRGPASVGDNSRIHVGSSIETSVIGPWSKVGGEIHGSIVQGYSNKAHPGYLGDSIMGSWCNLGADTNTSNLRNDYGDVSIYNDVLGEKESTNRIFAGLFMGDHSKCGINSMFNTGSVVGVSCNLYGSGYLPRYVPSFIWGGPEDGYVTYRLEKALRVARIVMSRRDQPLTADDEEMLTRVFDETAGERENGVRR